MGLSNPATGSADFRVGGSGFTVFHFEHKPLAFARNIQLTSPQPVAQPEAIQPLDAPRPLAILTPAAQGPGSLTVQVFEKFGHKVWDDVMKVLDDAHPNADATNKKNLYIDLVEVFIRLANIGNGVTCSKIVYPPNKKTQGSLNGQYVSGAYADNYYNCKIVGIPDDEDIDITTMSVVKTMQIMFTHSDRTGVDGGIVGASFV